MKLQRLWLLGVPLIAGTATGFAGGRVPGSVPECVIAERWVRDHAAALPSTMPELNQFTLTYRKEIFNALPRAAQLRLWHEQFARYERSEDLTTVQKAFVAEVDSTFDQYFSPGNGRAMREKFATRAIALFGPERVQEIFTTLGEPPRNAPLSGVEKPGGATSLFEQCNCSSASPIIGCGLNWCVLGGGGCSHKPSGCGWGWCEPCDGICVDPQ